MNKINTDNNGEAANPHTHTKKKTALFKFDGTAAFYDAPAPPTKQVLITATSLYTVSVSFMLSFSALLCIDDRNHL